MKKAWMICLMAALFTGLSVQTVPARFRISPKKAKEAMTMIQNLSWEGVAKSSGGNTYFDQDTMETVSTKTGDRRVRAIMKNTFTKAGSKALVKDSAGQISSKKTVDHSLFKVEYGETGSRIVSHVFYYDANNKVLLEVTPDKALMDVDSGYYGQTYVPQSIALRTKQKIFDKTFGELQEESDPTAHAKPKSSEKSYIINKTKVSSVM